VWRLNTDIGEYDVTIAALTSLANMGDENFKKAIEALDVENGKEYLFAVNNLDDISFKHIEIVSDQEFNTPVELREWLRIHPEFKSTRRVLLPTDQSRTGTNL
jgi:hypothetical protein